MTYRHYHADAARGDDLYLHSITTCLDPLTVKDSQITIANIATPLIVT
jgi:hypothetical protein